MPITGWIAILVLIVMCYMLIKQYETRMVLFGGGFILCCISLTPMAGLNAFAKTMTNGALIMAICSATGFAYCVSFTVTGLTPAPAIVAVFVMEASAASGA